MQGFDDQRIRDEEKLAEYKRNVADRDQMEPDPWLKENRKELIKFCDEEL